MLWVPCDDCHRPVPRLRRPRSSHLPDHGRPRLPRCRDIVTLPLLRQRVLVGWTPADCRGPSRPELGTRPGRQRILGGIEIRALRRCRRAPSLRRALRPHAGAAPELGPAPQEPPRYGRRHRQLRPLGRRAGPARHHDRRGRRRRGRGPGPRRRRRSFPTTWPVSFPRAGSTWWTLWDVIEHTSEPAILLEQACAALAPGGALFFETPDARFPLRKGTLGMHRATGGRVDRTGALYYWEHKVYFTESGLRRLLDRHGMRTVAVERWTSPRAKMTKLLADPGALGLSALVSRRREGLPLCRPDPRACGPRQQAHRGRRALSVTATEPPHHERVCGAVSVKVRPS